MPHYVPVGQKRRLKFKGLFKINALGSEWWRRVGFGTKYVHELKPLLSGQAVYRKALPYYTPPTPEDPYTPIAAQLDLTEEILGRKPGGATTTVTGMRPELAAGQSLNDVMAQAQKTTLAGIRILDSDGIVVSGPKETGFSFADMPEVREALAGHYKSVIRERTSAP